LLEGVNVGEHGHRRGCGLHALRRDETVESNQPQLQISGGVGRCHGDKHSQPCDERPNRMTYSEEASTSKSGTRQSGPQCLGRKSAEPSSLSWPCRPHQQRHRPLQQPTPARREAQTASHHGVVEPGRIRGVSRLVEKGIVTIPAIPAKRIEPPLPPPVAAVLRSTSLGQTRRHFPAASVSSS
jgi:hypothetical protein